jgi:hypothetical protein
MRALVLVLALFPALAFGACVDGTTPNCSDAASQCGPDLGDGAPLDAPGDAPADAPADAPPDAAPDVTQDAPIDGPADAPADSRADVADAGDAKG